MIDFILALLAGISLGIATGYKLGHKHGEEGSADLRRRMKYTQAALETLLRENTVYRTRERERRNIVRGRAN